MSKFLLDANLSPETREYLATRHGLDVIDLITVRKAALSDAEVVELARIEQRVIVTFDLDFGEIYHFAARGQIGVIILRLDDQTVESVNQVLDAFLTSIAGDIDLDKSLVILDEHRARVVSSED